MNGDTVEIKTVSELNAQSNAKTLGEQVFERYLRSVGINDFEYEKLPDGKRRPPDYTIRRDRDYLFEVKDFQPEEMRAGFNYYDPYERIRSKIDAARKKFREYEGWPCSLVLCNDGAILVDITSSDFILGAMYGDRGVVIPFNTETGAATSDGEPAFLGRGKMMRPELKKPDHTRISALISLRTITIGMARLEKYVDDCSLSGAELLKHLHEVDLDFDSQEVGLGVIVWENAYAAIPFPRDLFVGEYDEIYGVEGDHQRRVFVGKGVQVYEEIKESISERGMAKLLRESDERRKARAKVWPPRENE
jgi:hypothetical protein